MNFQTETGKKSSAKETHMAQSRGGGGSGWTAFGFLLFLVLAGLGMILYYWEDVTKHMSQPLLDEERARCEAKLASLRHKIPEPPKPTIEQQPSEAARRWTELTGSYPQWPQDLLEPASCTEVEEDFRALCQEFDRRPYLQDRLPAGGSFGLFSELARQLSSHLPVASGEMRLPGAVAANVFHLFRVVGKEPLEILQRIMTQEQALAEPAALVIYRYLAAQERCWKQSPILPRPALEDYSAFFLNTLGGQGYLRRRPPKISALAGFYSLVIMEKAALEGRNPHGLDLRPHIAFFRDLIRTQELLFKDRYLETLSNMEARWKNLSKPESEMRSP